MLLATFWKVCFSTPRSNAWENEVIMLLPCSNSSPQEAINQMRRTFQIDHDKSEFEINEDLVRRRIMLLIK